MAYNHKLPKKISLKPKKHHGFQVFLWLLGLLLPPLGELYSRSGGTCTKEGVNGEMAARFLDTPSEAEYDPDVGRVD